MKLFRVTRVSAPIDEVWSFFSDPANLARITPDSMGFEIVSSPDRPIREGDRIVYQLSVARVPVRWVSRIGEVHEKEMFVDVQEEGPYALWHHRHLFRETVDGVEMIDDVDYELPFGFIGRLGGSVFVRLQLRMIFDYREKVIREVFGAGDVSG
ncbi:MAG: SRPBCC family protein [Thermoanaerobaculia bacterium]|nr:SRPBCC family protein [Thermoanaerobaculia bacterium]